MGLAAAMMGPVLAVSRRSSLTHIVSVKPPGPREIGLVVVSGLFLAAHFGTWITSLSLTSVTHSTVLVTMHPVIVIAASVLILGETVSRRVVVGSLTAIGGAVILSVGKTVSGVSPTLTGNLLAVLGAVTVAGYIVIGRWARRSMSAASYNALVYLTAAVVLFPLARGMGQSIGPFPVREYLLFAALALFCTVMGHGVFNWALRYLPATEISLSVLLEPVFASIMAVILFQEVPGILTLVGAVIILGSLALVLYDKDRVPNHQNGR